MDFLSYFSSSSNNSQSQLQQQVATSVSITNETHTGSLKFKESKNWEGSNQSGGYPRTIWDNQTSQFTHQGGYWENSIGAVIYVGPNKVGRSDNCAWLVAWNVTRNGPSNHVRKFVSLYIHLIGFK